MSNGRCKMLCAVACIVVLWLALQYTMSLFITTHGGATVSAYLRYRTIISVWGDKFCSHCCFQLNHVPAYGCCFVDLRADAASILIATVCIAA